MSVGSLLAACAFTFATIAHVTTGLFLPLLASVVVGGAVGMLNGAIVTVGRVPSIIATLGMLLALRGVVLLLGANGILLVPNTARSLGLGTVLGVPAAIISPGAGLRGL